MESQVTTGSRNTNRWRFRFSIRTLLTVTALVAAYLALGPPTQTLGVRDVEARRTRENNGIKVVAAYKAPLLVEFAVHEHRDRAGRVVCPIGLDANPSVDRVVKTSSYYFWCFGMTAKLPFSLETSQQFPRVERGDAPN